jgi:hypothetical protein
MNYDKPFSTSIDDEDAEVRYDYDAGEPERWNGLTGVGNPAIGPSVEIYEYRVGNGPWTSPTGKEPWIERVEQEIIDAEAESSWTRHCERN